MWEPFFIIIDSRFHQKGGQFPLILGVLLEGERCENFYCQPIGLLNVLYPVSYNLMLSASYSSLSFSLSIHCFFFFFHKSFWV